MCNVNKARRPLNCRILRVEADKLRQDAEEFRTLCGGGDPLLCRMADLMDQRAAAALRLAAALEVKGAAA